MNTISESRADASMSKEESHHVLVWDMPVRVFHWLAVFCFAGAYLTAESEHWRLLHVTLGYTLAGLVVFRLLWGVIGTRHARFSSFVRGPAAAVRFAKSILQGQPEHHTGHNPAGALAILALLSLALLTAASGWATYNELAGDWLEEVHEFAANLMLAVVAIHVAGVILGSWMHKENLVRAMFTGRKAGDPKEGIRSAWRTVGSVMLVVVLAFWAWQWKTAPAGGGMDEPQANSAQRAEHDDD